MAFSDAEIAQLFSYAGHSQTLGSALPNVLEAFRAIQAKTDGGTQPSNATELLVRGYMAIIAQCDLNITNAAMAAIVSSDSNNSTLSTAKAVEINRITGQMYCDRICNVCYLRQGNKYFYPQVRTVDFAQYI